MKFGLRMKNKVFSFWGEDEIWGEGGILGNMKFGLRMKNSFQFGGNMKFILGMKNKVFSWGGNMKFGLTGEHEIWT